MEGIALTWIDIQYYEESSIRRGQASGQENINRISQKF